ncbi:hypothetical protein ACK3ZB_03785 [Aeromonas caviae]
MAHPLGSDTSSQVQGYVAVKKVGVPDFRLNLASRYRLEAGKHLSEVIDQRNAFTNVILSFNARATPQAIRNAFVTANLQPIISSDQFPNHWKKVMYQCLANSPDFFER